MKFVELTNSIEKKEWKFVFGIVILVIFITTLPYLYGWYKTPQDKVYTGIHFLVPVDYPVYYSYILQASDGNLLFSDLYSSETIQNNVINTIWLLPGALTKIFSLNPALSFQIARIFFIPFLLVVSYLLISYFFRKKALRKLSFIFFIFASGWGFYYLLFNATQLSNLFVEGKYIWPLDFWGIEAYTFLTLYYSPHFIASLALLLFTLLMIFLAIDNEKWSYSLVGGISALLLFTFHPFHFVTLYAIPIFYLLVLIIQNKKILYKKLINYIIYVLISSPLIIYYYWQVISDFLTQSRLFQNYCPTSPPLLLFFGYGGLLILSIAAIIYIFTKKQFNEEKNKLLVIWFIVQFVIIYFPLSFQRRLTEGLIFPMALLTCFVLFKIYQRLQNKRNLSYLINPGSLVLLFIFLFLVTPISQIGTDIMLYNRGDDYIYIDKAEKAAFDWLKSNLDSQEVILSSDASGGLIPGFSARRVYVGHGVETINFWQKRAESQWLFKADHDIEKELEFLQKRNIDYIYFSFREKKLGNFKPEDKPYLQQVFNQGDYFVYKIL